MNELTDEKKAFDWINKQEWTSKQKANAKYRWRKRHAPHTIKKRLRECNICYNEKPFREYERIKGRCCHCSIICRTCCERLNVCPYCREVWKQKEPLIPIILAIPLSELILIEQLLSQMNIFITRLVPINSEATPVEN